MATDYKAQLEGQRAAIREHIEKYETYPDPRDKNFALKTIRNCQGRIQNILRRHPHWLPGWEDDWFPGRPRG